MLGQLACAGVAIGSKYTNNQLQAGLAIGMPRLGSAVSTAADVIALPPARKL
jgi:hypothetical protein